MLTTVEMNKIFRNQKSALTRAKNKKDPEAIIKVVEAAFEEWDDKFPAWPDNWRLWQNAKDDAERSIRMRNLSQING